MNRYTRTLQVGIRVLHERIYAKPCLEWKLWADRPMRSVPDNAYELLPFFSRVGKEASQDCKNIWARVKQRLYPLDLCKRSVLRLAKTNGMSVDEAIDELKAKYPLSRNRLRDIVCE